MFDRYSFAMRRVLGLKGSARPTHVSFCGMSVRVVALMRPMCAAQSPLLVVCSVAVWEVGREKVGVFVRVHLRGVCAVRWLVGAGGGRAGVGHSAGTTAPTVTFVVTFAVTFASDI